MSSTNTSGVDSDLTVMGATSVGPITWDDATWILTSSFIIFTMQSGFGLLEAGFVCGENQYNLITAPGFGLLEVGSVSGRNEVNIMMKNAVDVIFGGISYWAIGYGLSFGMGSGTNPFCGVGNFFVDSTADDMGLLFATFVFQLSFATTATTIVSGAMAERTKLTAYIIYSITNTVVYSIPAHWEWATNGFLRTLGCVDIAGSGAVHLSGGVSALVAALLLKPRTGRYDNGSDPKPPPNAVSAMVGMFMLWWGWLAFNCGSTFGISGGKWKLASKAAVTTLVGSMGGGATGVIISFIMNKRKYAVDFLVNSVLAALVSITAGCAVIRPWESLIIGAIGAAIAIATVKLMDRLKIDDPVGATAVHGAGGIWGMVAVGLFAGNDPLENTTQGRTGVFHGGGFYLLGIQVLAVVCIIVWCVITTFVLLLIIKYTVGLRLSEEEERQGADWVEHAIGIDPLSTNYLGNSRPSSVQTVARTGSAIPPYSPDGLENGAPKSDVPIRNGLSDKRRGSLMGLKTASVAPMSVPPKRGFLTRQDSVVSEHLPGLSECL